MAKKSVGWRREHTRHVAAGKGIPTTPPKQRPLMPPVTEQHGDIWKSKREFDGKIFTLRYLSNLDVKEFARKLQRQGFDVRLVNSPIKAMRPKFSRATGQLAGRRAIYVRKA